MHIDEDERNSLLKETINESILDETDGGDSTEVVKTKSSAGRKYLCVQPIKPIRNQNLSPKVVSLTTCHKSHNRLEGNLLKNV